MNEHYGNPHASRTSTALLQSQNLMSLSLTCELRGRDNYRHLRNKIIFGTDWYLTHLTRSDDGAEYGNYCRDFKKLIDEVDSTFWIRFTLVNPWKCYSMSKEKLRWMAEALKKGGAKKNTLKKILNYLLKLDDEISRIREQLTKWGT